MLADCSASFTAHGVVKFEPEPGQAVDEPSDERVVAVAAVVVGGPRERAAEAVRADEGADITALVLGHEADAVALAPLRLDVGAQL